MQLTPSHRPGARSRLGRADHRPKMRSAVLASVLLAGAAQADTFTYDALNRMTQAVTPSASETYVYGEGEGRIKKVNGTLTTYYVDADYEENWNGSTKTEVVKHYFAGAQRLATRDNEGLKYQHPDHLGSASRLSDINGVKQKSYWYDPYGQEVAKDGLTALTSKYKYTDKEQDQTNLYYYGARYYDPVLGRFLSADSLLPNLYDPQQLNRYAYVRNNPVKLVDPSGHQAAAPVLVSPAAPSAAIFPGFDLASWDPLGTKAAINDFINRLDPRQYAPAIQNWISYTEDGLTGIGVSDRSRAKPSTFWKDTPSWLTRAIGVRIDGTLNMGDTAGIYLKDGPLTRRQMQSLTDHYGVEFGQTYNSYEKRYYLYVGDRGSVWMPKGEDLIDMGHTHPVPPGAITTAYTRPSAGDVLHLQNSYNQGSWQVRAPIFVGSLVVTYGLDGSYTVRSSLGGAPLYQGTKPAGEITGVRAGRENRTPYSGGGGASLNSRQYRAQEQ